MPAPENEQNAKRKLFNDFIKAYGHDPDKLEHLAQSATEQSNPQTVYLSEHALVNNGEPAVRDILTVERQAIANFAQQAQPHLKVLHQIVKETIASGHQVFLVGCGASGRMAFIVERCIHEAGYQNNDRIKAVLAGGDVAMVTAVPRFEDDPLAARKQLEQQGYQPGDAVIGFSASGSATFVLEAVRIAAEDSDPKGAKPRAFLMACNDAATIATRANDLGRSSLFDGSYDKRFHLFDVIDCAPPAVAGSTRMHPTTLQFLACLGVLSVFDARYEDYRGQMQCIIDALSNPTIPKQLGRLVAIQHNLLSIDHSLLYRIHTNPGLRTACLIPFQDITELTPTFGIPGEGHPTSLPLFKIQLMSCHQSAQAWNLMIGNRLPTDLNIADLPLTTPAGRLRFDFSEQGAQQWMLSVQTKTTVDIVLLDEQMRISFNGDAIVIPLEAPSSYARLIIAKSCFNAASTTLMARQGLVFGNQMIHVLPSNIKLLARTYALAKNILTSHPNQYGLNQPVSPAQLHTTLLAAMQENFMKHPVGTPIVLPTVQTCALRVKTPPLTPNTYAPMEDNTLTTQMTTGLCVSAALLASAGLMRRRIQPQQWTCAANHVKQVWDNFKPF